ncbi:hypothetical protein FVEG_00861 [Fusarium verticillioides 7600]|uniref:Uncharacterized protein n=1 Tax=Gibberella moniliformis (strain M3125 / FGSC 7600) TaxID=334819 RepID=W7LEU3_GIBM7|nr:hypothetical protein FVEG_00861 [Fusarium verticillioides 7600]EWG37101.1 hypothetical protein FVEG_00861 [Fusarium verticillioides 7600]
MAASFSFESPRHAMGLSTLISCMLEQPTSAYIRNPTNLALTERGFLLQIPSIMAKKIVSYVHAHGSATHCNDANGVNRGIYHYDLGFHNEVRIRTWLDRPSERSALDKQSMTAPVMLIV